MLIVRMIVGRVFTALVTLLLVSAVLFGALEILPGDVAARILGRSATQESLALLREELGLNQPATQRYLTWLGNIAHGDFGNALTSNRPISEIIRPRIFNTLVLSAVAFALYIPLALIPALVQAINRDTRIDHILTTITLLILSTPDFLLGTFLLIIFVVVFPVLPSVSLVDPSTSLAGWAQALAMPSVTLALVMAVYAVRMLRDNLIEVLGSDYIKMAELKGLPRHKVLLKHALPNSLIPTLNITALNLGYLIGGVVIVEKVFSFPGFGSLLVDSLQARDFPLVEATVMIAAAVYIGANLLADIASILVNPRLRNS